MLIEFPVVIAFDCHLECSRSLKNACTFTLRIEIDDDDAPLQYQSQYPPRKGAGWQTDEAGILAGILPSATYTKVVAAARAHPEDYEAVAQ